ncbi:histidinol-phosphate transaminase [Biformimicrobium ophioploci]|uniref:Histidinol-phosphate aminotransferase n=1 Tax=Biformimicrobium ophioploci TaxID=3036711 RepID=A0ABQ6LY84_9GAMM|nr:histidinol-phosphate transaminase [Microbulbifer sp. NKW57]GMG87034.1 histidinol-phosphate transaminase [Microbulbifer sp. NKW57]
MSVTSSPFWSEAVTRLSPYVPGEQPRGEKLVKLNTNENPYPPSPRVAHALAGDAHLEALRLYPDPESLSLRKAIAGQFDLVPEQVFVGNGSDEVLAHAFYAFFKREQPLLFADITYSFYPVYCQFFEVPFRTQPLCQDFSFDVDALAGAAAEAGGLIIANPNAPTGRLLGLADIENLLEAYAHRVVLVDEAYIDFGGESAAQLIDRYPNLLVVQTLSKSRSLAGLRLGYALGDPALITGLNRAKNSFNSYPIDTLTQVVAEAAIGDRDWLDDCTGKVISTRERVSERLAALGFDVVPSAANFVFAQHGKVAAAEIYAGLRKAGVLVRHFDKPRISNFLRISIGTDAEMDTFLGAVERLLGDL